MKGSFTFTVSKTIENKFIQNSDVSTVPWTFYSQNVLNTCYF